MLKFHRKRKWITLANHPYYEVYRSGEADLRPNETVAEWKTRVKAALERATKEAK